MNFAREIIRRAYAAGFAAAVDDGDGEYRHCANFTKAWEAVTAVDEAQVVIIMPGNQDWMHVINEGCVEPEETAANYCGEWIDRTWNELFEEQG